MFVRKTTLLIAAALGLTSLALTRNTTPQPDGPTRLTPVQWQDDLRSLAERMEAVHENLYHTIHRDTFAAKVQHLHHRIPELDDHEIIVGLARLVALVGDGHTVLHTGPGSAAGFRKYPIRLYHFEEGLFVQAVATAHGEAVGGRVLRIGNLSASEAFERAEPLAPRDNVMQVRAVVPTLLNVPEVLHALDIIEDMDRATYVVEMPDGRQHTLVLTPQPAAAALNHWSIEPAPELFDHTFVSARDRAPEATPLYLREVRRINHAAYLPDTKTLYARINAIADGPDQSFADLAAYIYTLADTHRPERLVIDLRHNGGGNNMLNLPLVHGLIERPWLNQPDKAFVLIGRHTFSAASHLVTALETHTDATFVGEPTGASPNHYGDAPRITLTHSGLVVQASSLYWQNALPWDRRSWTAPDVSVPVTFADYAANRDAAMEAVLAYTPQQPLNEQFRQALAEGATLEDLVARYRVFADDPRNAYANLTGALNALGYTLLREQRSADAVAIFRLNVTEHPDYANGYDSLGEALAAQGETAEAITAYEKALALDPEGRTGANARVQLEQLRALLSQAGDDE